MRLNSFKTYIQEIKKHLTHDFMCDVLNTYKACFIFVAILIKNGFKKGKKSKKNKKETAS